MYILQAKKYQSIILEQANFTYSPLEKALEKQTETVEDEGEKQIKAAENRIKKNNRYKTDI